MVEKELKRGRGGRNGKGNRQWERRECPHNFQVYAMYVYIAVVHIKVQLLFL